MSDFHLEEIPSSGSIKLRPTSPRGHTWFARHHIRGWKFYGGIMVERADVDEVLAVMARCGLDVRRLGW
jgi:hypothetical protein